MGKDLRGKELGQGLSQRKDGRYSARFKSKSGKRVEKYFDKIVDARRWITEAKYDDEHSNIGAASQMTVDTWFDSWIASREKIVKPNTVRNNRERYNINIKPIIGHMVISDVKPMHCQEVLNQMKEKYKGSTIYMTLTTMGSMFLEAEANEIIIKTPVTNRVKMPKPIEKKIRYLNLEEQQAFLKAAEKSSNYRQFRFVLETGVRTGEMIGLTWSCVDFQKKEIRIEKTLEYRHSTKEWRWGTPKTKAGKRTIPMTDACYNLLKEMYEERKKLRIIPLDRQFRDIVFLNRKNMPTKNSAYDTTLYKLCEKSGIEHFSMHSLRHTFATRCIEAGMNPKTLQIILGHASLAVTMNTYVHITNDEKQKGMQIFEQYSLDEKLA